MTSAEMVAIARELVPPVGAGALCLLVDDDQRHRVGFVVNGRQKVAVGPGFARPQDAARLMRFLDGTDPTPRSGQTTAPVDLSGAPSAGQSGAPEPMPEPPSRPAAADERIASAVNPELVICAGCGDPVPLGRHGQLRLTHGMACRVAAHRRRQAEARAAATHDETRSVTPSRPSVAVDHIGAEQPAADPGGTTGLG